MNITPYTDKLEPYLLLNDIIDFNYDMHLLYCNIICRELLISSL